MIKTYAARAYGYLSGASKWLWDNKPFVVSFVIGTEALMNYYGVKIPGWMVGVDAALGVGALHSSVKAQ